MSVNIRVIKPNLKEVSINHKKISTPIFFPSISSYGLKIPIEFTSNIIQITSFPRVLISSYDLIKDFTQPERNFSFIYGYMNNNILFIDSGCYESINLKDNSWNFDTYINVVKSKSFDIYTTYDVYPKPTQSSSIHITNTLDIINKSKINDDTKLMMPILHENSQENLLILLKAILSSSDKINAIAFSEKDLGFNILTILDTISKIKQILNDYDKKILLHILGCGDPKSIILYTYFGADSFDSRDWAKRAMNPDSLLTYQMSQLDIFDCKCNACSTKNLNEVDKLLLHNLLFYESFMSELRDWIIKDSLVEQLTNFFKPEFIEKVEKIKHN
jgi:queuine/archaeosine tRNA-ribosyltransferase